MNRLKQSNSEVIVHEHAYCVQQKKQHRPQNGQTISLYDEATETGQKNYTKEESKTCSRWRIPMKNKSLIFLMLMLIMMITLGNRIVTMAVTCPLCRLSNATIAGYERNSSSHRPLYKCTSCGGTYGDWSTHNYGGGNYCLTCGYSNPSSGGSSSGGSSEPSKPTGTVNILVPENVANGDDNILAMYEDGSIECSYTHIGDGALTVTSSDTSVATVTLDEANYKITITPLKEGNTTITLTSAATSSYSQHSDSVTATFGISYYMLERDGSKYDNLTDAYNAAENGDTIIVLKDVVENAILDINKNINLNLQGYTITKNSGWFNINNGYTLEINGQGTIAAASGGTPINVYGTLSLNNVTFNHPNTNAAYASLYCNTYSTLNITNSIITSKFLAINTSGKINISNSTVKSEGSMTTTMSALKVYNLANVTINDSTIIAQNNNASYNGIAIDINSGANVTINGGKVIGNTKAIANAGTLTIGDVSKNINNTNPEIQGGQYGITGNFNFNNGVIKGTNVTPYSGTVNTRTGMIIKKSGPVDGIYEAYLDYNYNYQIDGTEKFYNTLLDVNANATDGDIIKVLRDCTDASAPVLNKNVTLDTNGHTLTKTTSTITIAAGYTVEILGEGKISTSNQMDLITNNGTLTINDGIIEHTIDGYRPILNNSTGTIIINAGTISGKSWGIDSYGTITMNDGTIEVKAALLDDWVRGLYTRVGGNVTINGGEIVSENTAAESTKGATGLEGPATKVIKGGTINVKGARCTGIDTSSTNGAAATLTIDGDVSITAICISDNGYANAVRICGEPSAYINCSAEITGGTYSTTGLNTNMLRAICNQNNAQPVVIHKGVIKSTGSGIYIEDSTGKFTIGSNNTNNDLMIVGGMYGVESTSDFYFYDGFIKGDTKPPYTGTAIPRSSDYDIVTTGPDNGVYTSFNKLNTIISFEVEKVYNLTTGNHYYAKQKDKIEIILMAYCKGYIGNTLQAEDITIKVGDTVVTPTYKKLSNVSVDGNWLKWKLELQGITNDGELIINIPENKIQGNAVNTATDVNTGVIVDNTAPSNLNVKINYGAETTNIKNVNLSISAIGANYIYINNTGIAPLEIEDYWKEYTITKRHDLNGNLGTNTVYVWFKDYAGNISGPAIDTIEMCVEDYINNTGNAIYGEIFLDDQAPSDTAPAILSYGGYTKIICMQEDILKDGARSGIVEREYGYKLHSASEYTWVDTYEIKGINTTNTYDFVTRATDAVENTTLSKVTTLLIEESTVPRIELMKVYNLSTYNPAYVKQSDRVQITFKAITSDYSNNSLTVDDIVVKVGDRVVNPSQKTLSAGTIVDDGIVWSLTLSGISDNGLLTLEIPENKVFNSENEGNIETIIDTRAVVDNIVPTGTIIINDNATKTQAINVTLAIEADRADFMYISNELAAPGEFNTNWEEYVTSKPHTLEGEKGVNTVYVWFKDFAGNISVYASDTIEVASLNDAIQSSIFLDTQSPNNNAPAISATNNDVKVVTNQLDVYKDGVRSGIANIEYGYKLVGTANEYTYQTSDIIKNVSQNEEYEFVTRATDNAGNTTESLPTLIVIERNTAPIFKLDYKKNLSTSNAMYAKASDTLEFKISATSARYNNNSTLKADDISIYVGGIKISDEEKNLSVIETTGNGQYWQIILTNVTGNGELFIEIPADKAFDVDSNGNVYTLLETEIIVDNIKPQNNKISLANGEEKTKIQNVLANISSEGAKYMYVSNEQTELTEFSEEWIEYTNLKYHNLTDGYGEKTVYAWFKDEAGNISEMVSDTIIYEVNTEVIEDEIFLDTLPPTDDAPSILISTYAQIICNQKDPYTDGGYKSGIANIEYGYRVNGSSDEYTWQSSAILTHVPAIDYYEFVTKATDAAGNTTVSKPTVEYIDITQIYVDVIFDAGEGTVSPKVKTYVYGGNYTDLPIATSSQSRFSFEGWYTEENGQGTKITEDTIITNQYCHTLYASYKDVQKEFITEWTIPAGGATIILPVPANGANNYTVNWGDGTTNSYDTTVDFPTHEYTNTEVETFEISITGRLNQFGYFDSVIPEAIGDLSKYYTFTQYVTGIKQWGELNFTQIGFANCTNLTGTIPSPTDKSFENVIYFIYTFYDCKNLTGSIPADLFKNAIRVKSYGSAFAGCSGLTGTIPADLFKDSQNVEGFYNTFKSCTGLTGSIPATLFAANTNVRNFGMTFDGCNNLEGTIPANLFANNTLVEDFSSTFYDCIKLTGSIPATLFATNTKAKTFEKTFAGCKGLTGTIPENLFVAAGENVTSFAQTFIQCDGLSGAIPAGLFAANPNVTSFFYTFAYTDNFTSVPAGLFDNNVAITTNTSKSQGFAQTFLSCIGLKSAVVDSRFVGYKMFYGCNNLTEITVTDNVEAIYLPAGSEGAFRYHGSNPAILETTLYTSNPVAQSYDWAADNRAVNSNSLVVSFTPSSNATWSNEQSTIVKVVDDLSGVDESSLKYQWTQSTTAPTESSFTQSFTNESKITKNTGSGNNWYLWILAKNMLGNTVIVSSNEFYLDNNLPSVTVTAEGTSYGSNYILNVKDTHSGVVEWQVTDSSSEPTEWNAITTTNNANIVYSPTTNGTYYAWVKDGVGNVGSAILFNVNLTKMSAPNIVAKKNNYNGETYTSGVITNQNIAIELTNDYAQFIKNYEWSTNENADYTSEGIQINKDGVGRIIFDTEINGTVYFRAVDEYGNYSDVSYIEVKIDKTAPQGNIYITPVYENVDNKYTNSNTVKIFVGVADNYTEDANMKIALINEQDFSFNNNNDDISWVTYEEQNTWQLTAGEGLRTVYILIKDEAGNQSTYFKTY